MSSSSISPLRQAPEVIQRRGTSYGADWWGIGVLLYELLVGEPPFKSASGDPWCARFHLFDTPRLQRNLVNPSNPQMEDSRFIFTFSCWCDCSGSCIMLAEATSADVIMRNKATTFLLPRSVLHEHLAVQLANAVLLQGHLPPHSGCQVRAAGHHLARCRRPHHPAAAGARKKKCFRVLHEWVPFVSLLWQITAYTKDFNQGHAPGQLGEGS